jgi:hypothetical protein
MRHEFRRRPPLPFAFRVFTRFLIALVCVLAQTTASAGTSAHLWSKRFGGANDQYGLAAAVDAAGNVLISGNFLGTLTFGGSEVTTPEGGAQYGFLAKFNAAGAHQWSQFFAAARCVPYALAVDASGNVIITGSYYGSVNFGGAASTYTVSYNVFVAKFDPAGVHQWSSFFGEETFESDQLGYDVAVDAAGNVVITGEFEDHIGFGAASYASAGAFDVFVAKFDAAGGYLWSRRFGGASDQTGFSVAVDASGDVLTTGNFFGAINCGGSDLLSAGSDDVFVAKLNAGGFHQWSQRFGGSSTDTGASVTADASGGVTVTGGFGGLSGGTIDFGGGLLTSAGGSDMFLARFSPLGVHQWSQRFGSTGTDAGLSVTMDASENVVATGYIQGLVNFGGSDVSGAGYADAFVAKFSPGGVHQWSRGFGGPLNDLGRSVTTDASGNAIATGYFSGTLDLGGANLTSAAGDDIFLVKFGGESAEPAFVDIADIGNDQGGQVKLRFTPSGFDDPLAGNPVDYYEAYRRDGTAPVVWTLAGQIPAHVSPEYLVAASTLADSTISDGQHYSAFMIRAVTTSPVTTYDSPVDSGYSLDNLAPAVPTGFVYRDGALAWDRVRSADFDHYTVYGSNATSFGSAILIDHTLATTIDVADSPYAYYFVTASDAAGNEGNPAFVDGLSNADETPKTYILSVSAYPNPFNPNTTIRYTLPAKGRVTIAVYDARGAKIAVLVNEEKSDGAYSVPWRGRDDGGGIVSSGVYFARLEFEGETRAYKMLLLK